MSTTSARRIGGWAADDELTLTLLLGEQTAAHGPSPAALRDLHRWADRARVRVDEETLNELARTIKVSGPASTLARHFGVELGTYARTEPDGSTTTFRHYRGEARPPAAIARGVTATVGFSTQPRFTPHFIVRGPAASGQGYFADQVAEGVYGRPAAGTAKGQKIAIIELGGGFSQSDIDAYMAALNQQRTAAGKPAITPGTVTAIGVDGATNSYTGDPNSADGEVALDIQVALSAAPEADLNVYFAPNTEQGFIDAVAQALKDGCTAISISWGAPEQSGWSQNGVSGLNQVFQSCVANGVSVFASTGDNGSTDGVSDGKAHTDFPASSEYVVGCGGTTTPNLDGSGQTAWSSGGGGVSDLFAVPTYQQGVQLPASVNDGKQRRTIPDISSNADPATGYRIFINGTWYVFGGTSASSPMMASLYTDLTADLQAAAPGRKIGDFHSVLYKTLFPQQAIDDITGGSIGQYSAGPGYDAATGTGVPNYPKMQQLVLSTLGAKGPAPPHRRHHPAGPALTV